MAISGQTTAHIAHPIQFSGFENLAGKKPDALNSDESSMQPFGQVKIQYLQPLHLSESITIKPFLTFVCMGLILNVSVFLCQIFK